MNVILFLFITFRVSARERSGFFKNISPVLIFPMKIVVFRYVAVIFTLFTIQDTMNTAPPRKDASAAD